MADKDNKFYQCKSSKKNFKSLEDVVADYTEKYRGKGGEELRSYAEMTSFQEVVSLAAQGKAAQGKGSSSSQPLWKGIHSHQRRVGESKLSEFAKHLQVVLSKLKQATSFEELYDVVEARKVKGVAELTVYDTALRIGANLKIEPKDVYLHRGAKKGAENLGIAPGGRRLISVDELNRKFPAFRKLKPREVEDCLCVYKDAFQNIRRT